MVLALAEERDVSSYGRLAQWTREHLSQATFLPGPPGRNARQVVPIDRTAVAVKLAWRKDHLVEATVDDLRANFKKRTRFTQVPGEWKFVEEKGDRGSLLTTSLIFTTESVKGKWSSRQS